jgi:hypothetical protein
MLAKHKADVLTSFKRAEKMPKPKLGEMFNDVWAVKRGEEVPRVIVSRPSCGTGTLLTSRWSSGPNWADCSRSMEMHGNHGGGRGRSLWKKARMSLIAMGGVRDCAIATCNEAITSGREGMMLQQMRSVCIFVQLGDGWQGVEAFLLELGSEYVPAQRRFHDTPPRRVPRRPARPV